MLALLLGALFVIVPPDSTRDLEACLRQAPTELELPTTRGEGIKQMWTEHPSVLHDTLRAYFSQYREARECLRTLDPSTIESPNLGNIIRTFPAEAGLRRFSTALARIEEARSSLKTASPVPASEVPRIGRPQGLHQDLGYLHSLLGNLSATIAHYLRALQKTSRSNPTQRITYLLEVGILYQHIQDYRSAHRYYQRAEQLFRASDHLPENHPSQWARVLFRRADLLLEQTLNARFNPKVLERARSLARRGRAAADPGTERYASLSLVLSESLGYLNAFERAYHLNAEVRQSAPYKNDVRLQTFTLLKLGELHVQRGHWTRAETVLERSLQKAEDLGDLDYQRQALRALGRLHEIQREWTEAETYYRKGVSVVEKYRASLTASQWSMTALEQWRDVYLGLVRSLLAQDRNREALVLLDRSRTRPLRDPRAQVRVANRLSLRRRARFDSLSRALTTVRRQLGRSDLFGSNRTALRAREAVLMSARQQILDINSRTDRPGVTEIQTALDRQNRVLVSYFLDDPWPAYDRPGRSTAFVLTGDTLRTVRLPQLTQDSVRKQLKTISPLFLNQEKASRFNAMHFDLRPLHKLQEALYAPVAKYLSEDRPLTIVPSGPLFRVPFSMLVQSMPGGRYAPSEARFLLHEHPTTVELASSMVVDAAPAERPREASGQTELAAFGVSEFDTLRTVPGAPRAALPRQSSDSALALPNLPGVRSEIRAVQRHAEQARVFMDKAATKEAFRKASRGVGILHLASHTVAHPAAPLQNALLLHPDSTRQGGDRILFPHEIQARRQPLSLVVLSGCNTARGSRRGGEGLQYGFRAMGADATLSSLWPVSDESSAELIDVFYRHLQEGLRKDEALRQAKLEYLEAHPDRASPFFWAPFVLYGSPSPVNLGSSRPLPTRGEWGIALAGIVLGGLLLWRWKPQRIRPLT